MDLESFKFGFRLKRLQQTAKLLRSRTFMIFAKTKNSMETSGTGAVMDAEFSLEFTTPEKYSKEQFCDHLDKNEEALLEAALAVIGCLEEELKVEKEKQNLK